MGPVGKDINTSVTTLLAIKQHPKTKQNEQNFRSATVNKLARQLSESSDLSQLVPRGAERPATLQRPANGLKRAIIGVSYLLATANANLARDFPTRAPLGSPLGTSQDCIDILLSKKKMSPLDVSQADSLYSNNFKNLRYMAPSYIGEELKGVRYLNEQERLKCMVGFLDGKIIDGVGSPYDTTGIDQDDVIFVMDHMQNVFISPISPSLKVQHSSLLAGEPALMAGTISLKGGVPIAISDESGHYIPLKENMALFLKHLSMKGVETSQIKVTLN
jgi:hypothetical protein